MQASRSVLGGPEKVRTTASQSICRSATGLCFALDPLQDPWPVPAWPASSRSEDPNLKERVQTHRQETILAEAIHRIRRYRKIPEGTRLDIPLAVWRVEV